MLFLLVLAFFEPKAQCNLNLVGYSQISCYGGSNGIIDVSMSNAISYNLMPGNINNTVGVYSGLTPGTYTLTGTDVNSCMDTLVLTLIQPPPFTFTSVSTSGSCNGGCTGVITVAASGGTGALNFSISPNGGFQAPTGTFSGICQGTYTITATDVNGCTTTTTTTMQNLSPQPLATTITMTQPPSCVPGCDGMASLNTTGGLAPYTYSTNPMLPINASQISTVCANTSYWVTISDANGCTASTLLSVNNPPGPTLTYTPGNFLTCNNACNAAGTLNSPTAISYAISPSANLTGNTLINLCAGTYTVLAADALSCTSTLTINIPAYNLSVGLSVSAPDCGVSCNGTTSGIGINGTAPYSFNLTDGNLFNSTQPSGNFGNLCAATYTLTITDANNCVDDTIFNLTALPTNSGINPGVVTGPGSIIASSSGGQAPYMYSLNGSAFASANSFNNLCTGTYTLTVKDNFGAGCLKDTVVLIQADTAFPGVNFTAFFVNPSCPLTNNGMISLAPIPYSNTYTYQWNTNQTTSSISSLNAGTYHVIITNAAGQCIERNYSLNIIGNNCGNISGKVYYDSLPNCMLDPNEQGIPNTALVLNPGNFQTFTDALGNYTFNGVPYGNYTLTHQNNVASFGTICGNNFPVVLNAANANVMQNFGDSVLIQADYVAAPLYGNCFLIADTNKTKTFIYRHDNPTLTSSGTIYIVFDSINHFVYSNPVHSSISADTVFWNVNNITDQASYISVHFTFPNNYTVANTAPVTVGIKNLQYPDPFLLNNHIPYTFTFCNAYDPNDKSVAPKGEGPNGNILATDLQMTYHINFQNTGNAPAFNIVIEDTLSDKLDLSTFEVIDYSHPYQLEVINNQVIKWKFYNIMLPDSNSNEPASHGHITYQIRQKAGNQIGDVIRNKAYIYFDYNAPIITNETVNTIYQPTGLSMVQGEESQVTIYPNPATQQLFVDSDTPFDEVVLYNAQLQPVFTQKIPGLKQARIPVSNLSPGIYFVRAGKGAMKKVVIGR